MSSREQAVEFVNALVEITPGKFIEVRGFPATDDGYALQEFFQVGEADAAVAFADEHRDSHDMCVGVAPRDYESGKGAAVSEVGVIWFDFDGSETGEEPSFPITPSITVKSGTGENFHAYWLLDEPTHPDHAESLNRHLASQLGGDLNCCDRARVMRLPGSLNHKSQPPTATEIASSPGIRYSISDIEDALRYSADPDPEPQATKSGPSKGEEISECVQRFLDRVTVARSGKSSWQAHCPAHDDANPSLSVKQGDDGRCLLNCHAECPPEKVAAAVGLTMSDLFPDSSGGGKASQATMLHESVDQRTPELFTSPDGDGWISVIMGEKRETWRIDSREATRWFQRIFYEDHGKAIRGEPLRDVQALLEAQARFDGDERQVPVRVAGSPSGPIYVDLGDEARRAVKLDKSGPTVVQVPPAYFQRSAMMNDLPYPAFEGALDEMRPFVNVRDESEWKRFVGFLLMCFHPIGPYPVLTIMGEQGSAKSTLSRRTLSLVDPHAAGLLSGGIRVDDLALAASASWLVALDNISTIKPGLSDALCRVSTGGGLRRRRLYTDRNEVAIEFRRPVVLNGIGAVVKAPDLLERSVPIELVPISQETRRTEAELDAAWDEVKPRVFGGLMNTLCAILQNQDEVRLAGHPRMADFARWGEAAGPHLGWEPGEFSAAIESGQAEQVELSIDDHPEIRGLIDYIEKYLEVTCSATQLMTNIHKFIEAEPTTLGLARTPAQFSRLLSIYEPALRKHGIEFERSRGNGGNRDRAITVRKV